MRRTSELLSHEVMKESLPIELTKGKDKWDLNCIYAVTGVRKRNF